MRMPPLPRARRGARRIRQHRASCRGGVNTYDSFVPRKLVATAILVCISGVLAACSSGPAPTPSPTAGPATTRPLEMGSLVPGQYRTNHFEPQLILTLPEGWSQFFADEFDQIYMGSADAELAI